MASIFGQIDPAAFSLAIVGTIWAIEQGLGSIAKDSLKNYNMKFLRMIQSTYDQTDLLRPLLRCNHDMSDISITLLCDKMISTFRISSFTLWISIKICIFAQNSTFAIIKIILLLSANVFLFLHSSLLLHHDRKPYGAWTFDLEWSELAVKIAIEELQTQVFGDPLLKILYMVSQSKSGPLACKLPSKDLEGRVNIAELVVAAFALYNMDGCLVIENSNISVLGLATVTFECDDVFHDNLVTVNVSINEIILQFSINATAQCNNIGDAAYLVQYAIVTDNKWLLSASAEYLRDSEIGEEIREMAYAAGYAISINVRGTTKTNLVKHSTYYSNWINANFTYKAQLPWCQHDRSRKKCYCQLTHFLIMNPKSTIFLYGYQAERNIIVVWPDEDEAVSKLQSSADTASSFIRLSSQSQIIINSTQFKRTNRIVLAATMGANQKITQERIINDQHIIPVN